MTKNKEKDEMKKKIDIGDIVIYNKNNKRSECFVCQNLNGVSRQIFLVDIHTLEFIDDFQDLNEVNKTTILLAKKLQIELKMRL